jgi:hypothetical protein
MVSVLVGLAGLTMSIFGTIITMAWRGRGAVAEINEKIDAKQQAADSAAPTDKPAHTCPCCGGGLSR